MNYELRIKNVYLFLILIFLILLDQFSKYLIRSQGGFYICNEGIAFGINVPPFIFWIAGIVLIVLIGSPFVKGPPRRIEARGLGGIFTKDHNKNFIIHNSLILITAGALGNLIDRLRFGCVIDFIDLKFLPRSELVWGWPVFNFADIYITFGAILLVYSYLKNKNPRELG